MNDKNLMPRLLSKAGFSLYRGLDPSIYLLFAVRIINRFGDFVQLLLVLILTGKLGMDSHEAGYFISLALAATMVGQLVAGVVADKFARKYVLVFCQLMVSFSYLASACLVGGSSASLVPLLVLLGSPFRGATAPITNAMVADFSGESDRGRAFSLLYLGTNIGVAVGPMAAAFLYSRSLVLLFGFSSVLLLFSTALLIAKVPLVHGETFSSGSAKIEGGFVASLLKNKVLLFFLLLFALYDLTYLQNSFALPLQFTSSFGDSLGTTRYGFLMTINALTVLATTPFLTRVTTGMRQLRVMALAMLFYVMGYGAYAFCTHYSVFLVSTFIWTLGEILMATNANVFLNAFAPPRYRTRFNALFHIAGGLGSALAPTVGGLLLLSQSYMLLWVIMAMVCLGIGLSYLVLDRRLER
ncbi:MFS transporter [Sphaerochaeta sp. PS]|uniref:MFS transporter n=1 Tax=Sphaerochaeta sp. PS TaxID=3076336 RepID=UPI0028A4C9B6|nr:MFS transporter [Sphaerochaeta sp. PS]MDT4762731.1 MFS transporter [Sphaerochaeta sp. PS]